MADASGDAVPIVGGEATVSDSEAVASTSALSLICALKLKLPAAEGAPAIAPEAPPSVKPGGSAPPETDQTYGCVPPVPVKVCEYGFPILPAGREVELVMVSWGAIVNINGAVAVTFAASVKSTEKPKAPAPAGSPISVPE